MQKRLLKHKSLIALIIFMGVLSFSVCHASVMPQNMDKMDCQAQAFCVACPIPVTPGSPDLSHFFTQFEIFQEKSPFLPDPVRDSFYHPPR